MVARLGSETRQREEVGSLLPWAGAIALATIVFLAAFAWHQTGSVPVRTASDTTVVEQTAPDNHSGVTLRLPDSGVLAELSRKWDQPLETEMKSVFHDARAAVNLLAYNFLPDTLLASRASSLESP